MIAVVPGSFDPFTYGHRDVVRRAHALFGQVVVAVTVNTAKEHLLDLETRTRLVRECCAGLDGVSVEPLDGLLVAFCAAHDARIVVKGARSGTDFDYEQAMAQMNASLGGVETVVLPAAPSWCFVSSTFIRQIARAGGDVSPYVPPAVALFLESVRPLQDGSATGDGEPHRAAGHHPQGDPPPCDPHPRPLATPADDQGLGFDRPNRGPRNPPESVIHEATPPQKEF